MNEPRANISAVRPFKAAAFVIAALCFATPHAGAVDVMEADVACAYSPAAVASAGSEPNIQVWISGAIAGANAVHDNSGTGVRWHVAGYLLSSANPIGQTGSSVLGGVDGTDPNYQDIRDFGVALGADLVDYVVPVTDVSGIAQQPGMYSVIDDSAAYYVVFAHEIGHNYGANHADGLGFNGTNGAPYRTIMLHNYCGGSDIPYYSNPNLYYRGVQLLGSLAGDCGTGSLANGGNNAGRVASYAQTVSGTRTRVVALPDITNVIYRWSFTNAAGPAPAGATILDQVSGAPAVVRGVNSTFTGGALRLPGGTTGNAAANSIAGYLDLPNGILSAQTNVTIEIWATPLSSQNWQRLCSFGRTIQAGDGLGAPGEWTGTPGTGAPGPTAAYDEFALSLNVAADLNQQRFIGQAFGLGTNNVDSAMPTLPGAPQHYTITFEDGVGANGSAGGRMTWYRNGDPVTRQDVAFHLNNLQDVNNWLGRSLWSADSMANAEYLEVRISNVALSRLQVQANYRLGPNYTSTSVTLNGHDAVGLSSFNSAGNWSDTLAPGAATDYDTLFFTLRTPAAAGAFTFQGNSLKVSSGGVLLWKGTASSTITVSNLVFNGGTAQNAGSGTFTLAGGINMPANGGTFSGVNGANSITASLTGSGPITYVNGITTLSGANAAFTGRHVVGAGAAGTLAIDSEARLGANPAAFTPDVIRFNNGTLQTTTSFAIAGSNRGITLDLDGGAFSPVAGTTLTISNSITGVGSLAKAGPGTLVLNGSNSFSGALNVDTGSTTTSDGVLRLTSGAALANSVSPVQILNNNTGSSTLQLDGSRGSINIARFFNVNCRAGSVATIQNLAGTNTLSGNIWLNTGGNLFNIQSDAGLLVLSGTNQYIGSLTGSRTYAFTGAGDLLVTGPILNSTNGAPINLTKSGAGRLTLAGANTCGGTTTINAGTLFVTGSTGTGAVTVAVGTLRGTGVIGGPTTLQPRTILAPGVSSLGTLSFSNTLTLLVGSTNVMKLDKTSSTNDSVRVGGTLTYGGTLALTNLAGTLTVGDSFKLFSAPSYAGAFSFLTPATPGVGLVWNTNSLAVDGTLSVALGNVSPRFDTVVLAGGGLVFSGSGGAAAAGYSVLTSTNLSVPLADWSVAGAGTFDSAGYFSFTNQSTPVWPEQFFNLRIP